MSPRPSWGTPLPQQPEPERSYPERYIFLLLFFIVFICILKRIQYYRPREEFDSALDELDVESGMEAEGGVWNVASDGGLYWDVAPGHSVGVAPIPGGTYQVDRRANDDAYQAGVSSLVALDEESQSPDPNHNSSFDIQTPEHDVRMLSAQRVQFLVAQLRTASYAARDDPEGSPDRRGIEVLRRQIMEMMVVIRNSDYASRPPPDLMEPPPAYSDVVEANECASVLPPSQRPLTRPTPPRLIIP